MATTRALAADGEVVQSTELIVTSALATWVTAFLPPVGDGTASTVVDNSSVAFYANALGGIYVKDQYGHSIGTVNRYIKLIASDGLPVYIPAWR